MEAKPYIIDCSMTFPKAKVICKELLLDHA
jgi:hypothetical protein